MFFLKKNQLFLYHNFHIKILKKIVYCYILLLNTKTLKLKKIYIYSETITQFQNKFLIIKNVVIHLVFCKKLL